MLDHTTHKQNIREFHDNLTQQLRQLRAERHIDMHELSGQSCISLSDLVDMEARKDKNWDILFRLARFYDKKIKIEFY